MKKMISLATLTLLLFSCSSNHWNKEYAKKNCIDLAFKTAPDNPASKGMVEKLCDCAAGKMAAKYKTEEEANKDIQGVQTLTMDCMKENYAPSPAK
jgi:hypothetical protein